MSSTVDQIKTRLDVADLIGQYVQLNRAGVNMKGLCPFHQEKTPSFIVSPARQTWHCFGCNKGGDAFSFLQEIEGLSFREALDILGQRTGVEVKAERPEVRDKRDKSREANELAAQFYRVQLQQSAVGKKATAYLVDRGLLEDTMESFRLGFAPTKENALLTFLLSKGFNEGEILEAGLAMRNKQGIKDRFRGRIMFPIADGNDRVVGFTGRIFGRDEDTYDPKYLNTPETPIFEKRRMLYGLHRARRAIRKNGYAVLVEGQTDCLMAHQAGTEGTVATSGTALTDHHIMLLKRLADTLIIAYDADAAGIASAKRGIELALEAGMQVRVALVPEGQDPAEFIAENKEQWIELLEKGATPVLAFLMDRAVREYGVDSPEAKQRVVDAVLPLLAKMANVAEQAEWMTILAQKIGIAQGRGDEALWEQLKRVDTTSKTSQATPQRAESSQSDATLAAPTATGRRAMLEEHLLALLLLAEEAPENGVELFLGEQNRTLYQLVEETSGPKESKERIGAFASSGGADAEKIALKAEMLIEVIRDAAAEVDSAVREIRRYDVREHLDTLTVQLERAEQTGDSTKIRDLTQAFHMASKDLAALATA